MGIYDRDQIDYGSMIDRAINNRMGQAYRESDRIIKRGDIRAQTAKDLASTFARGMDYIQYAREQKELENKLKDMEERRDYIRSQYDYNADYKPYSTTPEYKASEYMNGYNTDSAKDQWLQAHPGMTEEDYNQFVAYQNALYGGR